MNSRNTKNRTKDVIDYYNNYAEKDRLKCTYGKLEFAHMTELLMRYLPKVPSKICDIGGATGEYAFYFAKLGYESHLLDLVPRHIEQAKERAKTETYVDIKNFIIGDALDLPYKDNSFDAIFLSGPLYHLPARNDRLKALKEAKRVLKPDGVITAYSIGRYATLFYGVSNGMIFVNEFMENLKKEVTTGFRYKYSDDQGVLDYAYFHFSEELKEEFEEVGFKIKSVHGVIGVGWMVPNFDEEWENEESRKAILEVARMCENIPDACSKIFIASSKE